MNDRRQERIESAAQQIMELAGLSWRGSDARVFRDFVDLATAENEGAFLRGVEHGEIQALLAIGDRYDAIIAKHADGYIPEHLRASALRAYLISAPLSERSVAHRILLDILDDAKGAAR